MVGQRGGLPLSLLLLSLAVLDFMLGTTVIDVTVTVSPTLPTSSAPKETMALLPTTNSTTAATVPPSSPETSTPELLTDAFTASTATPRGSSAAASSITTPQARGGTAHSTPGSPAGTTLQPDPTPTGLGLTTGTPTPTPVAVTPNCAETTIVTSLGTSMALAVSSFGVKTSPLPPSTSTLLSSTWVGTTLGTSTSTRRGPAVATLLGSASPGTGSASSPTAPAPTATSDGPSTTLLDTTAVPVTSTGVPGSTPTPSQPAGTTPGTSTPTAPETPGAAAGTTAMDVTVAVSPTHPTSPAPMETSALLPTTDFTTAATVPPSRPETEASTPERSSTSPGTGSASSTEPAPTAASDEPSMTPSDTMATLDTSTGVHGSTPAPSQPVETTARATPDISTVTVGPIPDNSTAPETPSAATGTEPSFPATNSTQTPEVTLSTPADLPMTLPVSSTMSKTGASHLFLSLRLTVPLDLGNTTVQELVLSKLRRDLQMAFPYAGLAVEWRGQRRT